MIRILKPYDSIPNFLSRFTLLKVGSLHIRLHRIEGEDRTTLLHNHPFHYCSLVMSGGYEETVVKKGREVRVAHSAPAIIVRSRHAYHRIESVKPETKTLFVAFGNYGWKAKNMQPRSKPDGIFRMQVKGKILWCKRENDIWFVGQEEKSLAAKEERHSIYQDRDCPNGIVGA